MSTLQDELLEVTAERDRLRAENERLEAEIAEHDNAVELVQEYVDATKAAMDEECGKGEKHCTCVPLLRFEVKRHSAEAATYAKTVQRLQKAFDDQCNASRQDAAEIERIKRENERLREALNEYGTHKHWCEYEIRGGKCDCGFDEALAQKEAKP